LLQHTQNGINKEEASGYVQFTADFFLFAFVVAKNTQNAFSEKYHKKLCDIFEYIYQFTDIEGNHPEYGDTDDGFATRLEFSQSPNNFKSLLTTAAILTKNPKYIWKSAGMDLKNQLLFGTEGEQIFSSLRPIKDLQSSIIYSEEGHAFLRSYFGNNNEVYIHIDSAPLGYLSIAAHGHADALSFVMNINGQKVFIDSGTYSYHYDPVWRKYFVSTLAHNTVSIDRQNQALFTSPTHWTNHYKCEVKSCITNASHDFITVSHNGYRKMKIEHLREFYLNKNTNILTITDDIFIKDGKIHLIDIPFHIHPEVSVTFINNTNYILSSPKTGTIIVVTDNQMTTKMYYGSYEPHIGWYSDKFGKREKCTAILCSIKTSRSVRLVTKIALNQDSN